jgi:uncharacterized protein YndB with AHSA1/START domain
MNVSKKQKYQLEYEIHSSPKILFSYLSTASGLEEWFAEKVNMRDGEFIFLWEGSEARAKMVSRKDNQLVKYRWVTDDKKDETFFQFEIQQDEITSDVALIVTDFATDEEKAENIMLWNSQIHALMHHIGS